MTTPEMALRLAAALSLGAVIGVERQWRARMAGLRTNALVATGAALFVLLSAYSFDAGSAGGLRADPTRIAAQIVSGIGFLGAGVILRDGLTVRGLNTAATLWCSAAVGSLAGAGMYSLAGVGTVAIIIANVALRPLARRLNRHPTGGDEIGVEYRLQAICAQSAETHIRTLLIQVVAGTAFALRALRSYHTESDHQVTVTADLATEHRDDHQLEQVISRLSIESPVIAVSWTTRPDADDQLGSTPPTRRREPQPRPGAVAQRPRQGRCRG